MVDRIEKLLGGRSVFVTGHTGFKGSWLCLWLRALGARVTGYSNGIPTSPSAFKLMRLDADLDDLRGEIADREAVLAAMTKARPSVVFHLAAQPIVRQGFRDPFATFEANVMGTVAVLEAARKLDCVEAVVIVTSDKVYDNAGSVWAFRETDRLGGHEPYGASKAAAEIVVATYRSPGFHKAAQSSNFPAIATARAGNVIGGGDWAADRLIPDLVRAIAEKRDQTIRQPRSTRPWQHVLEPLGGYLTLAGTLLEDRGDAPTSVNFGPSEPSTPNVEAIASAFLSTMKATETMLKIEEDGSGGEARTLRVDSSLALEALHWRPCWTHDQAIRETADWYKAHQDGKEMLGYSQAQLARYRASTPVERLTSDIAFSISQ